LEFCRLSERSLKASGVWSLKLLEFGRLSEAQVSCKQAITIASVTWLLERAAGRLSEQCPVQLFFVFRFIHLGTNPGFLKCFF